MSVTNQYNYTAKSRKLQVFNRSFVVNKFPHDIVAQKIAVLRGNDRAVCNGITALQVDALCGEMSSTSDLSASITVHESFFNKEDCILKNNLGTRYNIFNGRRRAEWKKNF